MQGRVWAFVLVVALAAPVGAQEATFSVSQDDVPAGEELEAGSSTTVGFGVGLSGDGFTCAMDVEAPVNATLEADVPSRAPANASVDTEPASATFPIPAGNYLNEPYNQSTTMEVEVATQGGVRENYTATLSLESVFPGGTYDNCVPSEFPEASSDPAEISLDVIADDPPEPEPEEPPENDSMGDNETGTPNGSANTTDEDDNGIPMPWPAGPLAAVGAALLLRGRDVKES